ncbi:hypothetical protein U1Q18_006722 [Sarracenia purpurea var. burkii]
MSVFLKSSLCFGWVGFGAAWCWLGPAVAAVLVLAWSWFLACVGVGSSIATVWFALKGLLLLSSGLWNLHGCLHLINSLLFSIIQSGVRFDPRLFLLLSAVVPHMALELERWGRIY